MHLITQFTSLDSDANLGFLIGFLNMVNIKLILCIHSWAGPSVYASTRAKIEAHALPANVNQTQYVPLHTPLQRPQ